MPRVELASKLQRLELMLRCDAYLRERECIAGCGRVMHEVYVGTKLKRIIAGKCLVCSAWYCLPNVLGIQRTAWRMQRGRA
jgi:hypothetical protein